jgi:gamma-glutamyltranspeptidase
VDAPRHNHQWYPDKLTFEGVKQYPDLVQQLQQMGHKVEQSRQGDAHSIVVDAKSGFFIGEADTRLSGSAKGF